jgi:hypothetical protein
MPPVQYHLAVDRKRRSTWPVQLLAEAGLTSEDELVASADPEQPGRVIVESRETIRRRIRQRAAEGRRRVGYTGSGADDLMKERQRDRSARD